MREIKIEGEEAGKSLRRIDIANGEIQLCRWIDRGMRGKVL